MLQDNALEQCTQIINTMENKAQAYRDKSKTNEWNADKPQHDTNTGILIHAITT